VRLKILEQFSETQTSSKSAFWVVLTNARPASESSHIINFVLCHLRPRRRELGILFTRHTQASHFTWQILLL